MKRILVAVMMMFSLPAPVCAREAANVPTLAHVWAGKRIPGAIWGIASGDVDGNGEKEIVLLKRNAILIGLIGKDGFEVESSHEWKGFLEGVRLYTMNLDEDPAEEIVISAVDQDRPASFAIKFADGKFKTLFERQPWHLRSLATTSAQKTLIGQQWNRSSFFAGSIYEFSFESGGFWRGKRFELPRRASLFDFAVIPSNNDEWTSHESTQIMRLSGNSPLQLYERQGKRWKKIWSSGVRYGGTMNLIEAKEREPLGIAGDEYVSIDREPQVIMYKGKPIILALQHDIPLKNIVGRRPYIRSGKIAAFAGDPSLGFYKVFETEEVPGFISDFDVYKTAGTTQLIVSVQPDTSAFYEDRDSTILIFDLPYFPG